MIGYPVNKDTIRTILFDIGGVLVHLHGQPFRPEWLPDRNNDKDVFSYWKHSAVVKDFESGRLDADIFAERFISENGLDIDRDLFLQHLLYWPNRLFEGVPEMLVSLGQRYQLAALSNSNALHWPRLVDDLGLGGMIPDVFSSHEIGVMKPDRRAFEHVLDRLALKPDEVLFLDDLQASIDVASTMGIQAVKVVGSRGGVETVSSLGLL